MKHAWSKSYVTLNYAENMNSFNKNGGTMTIKDPNESTEEGKNKRRGARASPNSPTLKVSTGRSPDQLD
jgi:hypothetical protein